MQAELPSGAAGGAQCVPNLGAVACVAGWECMWRVRHVASEGKRGSPEACLLAPRGRLRGQREPVSQHPVPPRCIATWRCVPVVTGGRARCGARGSCARAEVS